MARRKTHCGGLRKLLKKLNREQRATFLMRYARLHAESVEKSLNKKGYDRKTKIVREPTIAENAAACLDGYWGELDRAAT